jgi:hypothetical protein
VSILPVYLERVNDTATFADIADLDELCTVLLGDDGLGAPAEFMALLLNDASDRLCHDQPITPSESDAQSVGQAVDEIDGLLSQPSPTEADYLAALTLSREINTGDAVPDFLSEEVTMSLVADEPDAVIMNWESSEAALAGRPGTYGVYRSRTNPPTSWTQVGSSICPHWHPDWHADLDPGCCAAYVTEFQDR